MPATPLSILIIDAVLSHRLPLARDGMILNYLGGSWVLNLNE